MKQPSTGRFWRTIALGIVGLLLLAGLVLVAMAWQIDREWQQRLSAIRAAGDPVSIADLTPAPIPDDENAAFYLRQISPQLKAFEKDQVQWLRSPAGKAYDEARSRVEPPTPDQITGIRQVLDKYPAIDRGLADAADCDEYASLMDFSLDHRQFLDALIDQTAATRSPARFLRWRMEVLIAEGEPDEAVERGIELLRLARLHDAEPTLVNYLVGIAVRGMAAQSLYDALSAGPVSPELHAALDQELARHDDPHSFVRVLKTERAVSISGLASMIPQDTWFQRSASALLGWMVKRYWVGMLDYYDVQIDLAGRPSYEVHRSMGSADAPDAATGFGVMAKLMVPAFQAAFDAHARNLAVLRALRIDNALTEYRDEHSHEAAGLDDLALPKAATIDPFSGQPLRLKHTDDGWIIYSVMTNGTDDGGDFKDLKDYGLAPAGYWAE